MDTDGEEKTIATAGPLEVFARCRLGDGGEDFVEVVVTSSEPGWICAELGVRCDATTLLGSGALSVALRLRTPAGQLKYALDADGSNAIGPDAEGALFFISIDGDTLGLGLNIFGHKCLAVGIVSIMEIED